ncbi:MAG: hypothetical protein ABR985_20250 [Methanotrichaceae archaeon]
MKTTIGGKRKHIGYFAQHEDTVKALFEAKKAAEQPVDDLPEAEKGAGPIDLKTHETGLHA